MNHDQFEKLLHTLRDETPSLSGDERAKMRSVLRDYIAFKPVATPVPSPYYPYRRLASAFSTLANSRASYALTAFLVLGLTSVSVASAAEGALPGDALYSVKVDVVEPIRIALASSAEGKIAWERVFAERRLTEAAALADQGRLNPSTEATLVANFEHYATLALKNPTEPESDARDTSLNTDLTIMAMRAAPAPMDPATEDFSARLAAHETVLTEIDAKHGKELTRNLRSVIRSRVTTSAEVESEADAATEIDGPQIARLKVAADTALNNSALLVTALPPSVATATTERAQQALREAEAYRSEGEELLKKNDAKGASRALKNSLKAAARLHVFTQAAASFKIDAFSPTPASTALTATSTVSATTTPATGDEEPRDEDAAQQSIEEVAPAAPSVEASTESGARSYLRSKLGF